MGTESALGLTFDEGPAENQEEEPQQFEEAELSSRVEDDNAIGVETDEDEGPDDEDDQPKKVTFTPEQQKVFDNEISRKVAKLRETERENQRLAQQLQEIQAKLPKDARPEIPPVPDPWDAEYEAKLQARDEAMAAAIRYDQQQEFVTQQQQYVEFQQRQQQIDHLQQAAVTYTERATKQYGINPQDLQAAGQAIVQSGGIDHGLELFILDDEAGPAYTMYLARNPLELEKVREMNPTRAAVYLAKEIGPKLVSRNRQQPPPPARTAPRSGGGAQAKRGPKGVTYE